MTATTREQASKKQPDTRGGVCESCLGNPQCKIFEGHKLDEPAAAGTHPVLVRTDADWARDVKDRRSSSGMAVCVKSSAMETWPVYASSKKQKLKVAPIVIEAICDRTTRLQEDALFTRNSNPRRGGCVTLRVDPRARPAAAGPEGALRWRFCV